MRNDRRYAVEAGVYFAAPYLGARFLTTASPTENGAVKDIGVSS
jgi:hypothetical protein